MGGFGSGSWYRWNSKNTTESQHRIDVRLLKRWGYLKGDSLSIGRWSWSRNGEQAGSVGFRVDSDHMVLNYRHRNLGGEWEAIEQHIHLDRTPCNYGGFRRWFLCPRCSRRVLVLYGAGKYFLCRHCHRLTYSSQQENFADRMMSKARKIRTRMDKNNCLFDQFPLKPKYMHWKTYYRLHDKAERANRIGLKLWERRLNGMHALLRVQTQINASKDYRGSTLKKKEDLN